jgi:hypothetical protein
VRIFLFALVIVLVAVVDGWGQKVIRGMVKDENTDERIPFASVIFPGTTTGTTANDSGEYLFLLPYLPGDSVSASTLGYASESRAVNRSLDSQTLNFSLSRTGYTLKAFTVNAGVNPALIILRKIIRNKPRNNNDKLDSYTYEVYNKLELDIDKINKDKLSRNPILKPFSFIFKEMDSTSEDKPFLPIFLTETISDYYFQKKPARTKEVIKASQRSGLNAINLTEYLGTMYQNINIYHNFLPVFDKSYISPISDIAAVYYDYRIVDTQYIDQRRCFHLTFTPKRKGENTFFGDFWVNDTTFAIQKMNMEVSPNANINFISRISLTEEFRPLNDSLWFLVKDKFIADFVPPKGLKTFGIIGRKTTYYRNIIVNDTAATNIFESKQFRDNVNVLPGADTKNKDYWDSHRGVELGKNEKAIYAMVDTLQKMPLFQKYSNAIQFITTGKKAFGPVEFGPYYYEFSEDHLENYRVELDMGTTTSLSKSLYLNGYAAYGFQDRTFKEKIGGLWLLNRDPWMYLYGSYTHDLDNGGLYNDEISTDNIFTLAVRKPGIPQKFVLIDEKRLEFFKEWYNGFSVHAEFTNKKFSPFAPLPTSNYFQSNANDFEPLNNSEIALNFRYAYHERFLKLDYSRISLGSSYPIVQFKYSAGLRGVLQSNYTYHKYGINISDNLSIAPFGNLSYDIYAGKINGTLPYLLLEVHPGNELYYYDSHAFNMMNRYEYLSDQYAGFNIEHDIGGGIFDYIPFIRRLKFRQFWTAKAVIGSLSAANQELNLKGGYPFMTLKNNPYMELGTGVSNILRFLRVDFIWRVLPKPQPSDPSIRKFGVFGSFQIDF